MKVAIVHYHLRPGGLSRAIVPTFSALQKQHQSVFFTGEIPEDDFPDGVPCAVMHGLDDEDAPAECGPTLARSLLKQAEAAFGSLPDVWHFFNPFTGKNLPIIDAVSELAKGGHRLLLHLSDFAEDGRAATYQHLRETGLRSRLYPVAPHIHYSTINRRDFLYMQEAGVPSEQLHYLRNPVTAPAPSTAVTDDARLCLYPTRGIRRKNVGELLLWSAVRDDMEYGLTLPPDGGVDCRRFAAWWDLVNDLNLPVRFNLGQQPNVYFTDLVEQSRAFITTSVNEAFGLAFLEPWLSGRPVVGRALPEVITEFGAEGIELEHLYEQLNVPLEWLDTERLGHDVVEAWKRSMRAYGRDVEGDDIDRIRAQCMGHGHIDFGFLSEAYQAEVVRHVTADSDAAEYILQQLPDAVDVSDKIMQTNVQQIRNRFSPFAYGERLKMIYQRIAGGTAGDVDYLDADVVLAKYLQPERFSLLRAVDFDH
jgi:hypothetical protein